MTVTAEIDVARPTGRQPVRELEGKQCITRHFANPGVSGVWHHLDDVIEEGLDTLTAHYGVDMRALMKKHSKTYQKNVV